MSLFEKMKVAIEQPGEPIHKPQPFQVEVPEVNVPVIDVSDGDAAIAPKSGAEEELPEQARIICNTYEAIARAYFQIPTKAPARKIFRLFLAKSATLKMIDAALDKPLAILRSDASDEVKTMALKQLREGMDYWLKVCLEKLKELGWKPKEQMEEGRWAEIF